MVYIRSTIPDSVDSPKKVVDFAVLKSKEFQSEACLILNRKKSIWFNRDGSLKFEDKNGVGVAGPFMSVGGKQFIFSGDFS